MGKVNNAITAARSKADKERTARQDEDAKRELEHKAKMKERASFLSAATCRPTSAHLYAVWLAVWLEQGGDIQSVMNMDYARPGTTLQGGFGQGVEPLHAESTPSVPTYDSNGYDKWMPTTWPNGLTIPAGYGAFSLELMILLDLVPADLRKTSRGYGYTVHDDRPGWEWGHTSVLTLQRDESGPFGLKAWTNDVHAVRLYNDVEQLLSQSGGKQLAAKLHEAIDTQSKEMRIAGR